MADQLDIPQAKQFLKNEQKYTTPEEWERPQIQPWRAGRHPFPEPRRRRGPHHHDRARHSHAEVRRPAAGEDDGVRPDIADHHAVAESGSDQLCERGLWHPENISGWATDRAYAGRVIQRFKALSEAFIEQYGDLPTNDLSEIPGNGQPIDSPKQVAIDQYSTHAGRCLSRQSPGLMDAYRDWRSTDDGQDASNVLLAAVAYRFCTSRGRRPETAGAFAPPPPPDPTVDETAPDAGEQTKMQIANRSPNLTIATSSVLTTR
jgi:hypothetical protein